MRVQYAPIRIKHVQYCRPCVSGRGSHTQVQLRSVITKDSYCTLQQATRRGACLPQVRDLVLVGYGSVGLVYRGRLEPGGGGHVAVKYLVAKGRDAMAAPATEGLLSRALQHPNIVTTISW